MRDEDASKAQRLEEALKGKSTREERERIFDELCRLYANDLQADAIKWAYLRHSEDPTSDGLAALSRAFILLARDLKNLDFGDRTLLFLFKGKIWSEIGHSRARRRKRVARSQPIEDGQDFPVDTHEEERLVSEDQLRQLFELAKNSVERSLLRAAQLRSEGISWADTAKTLGWMGTTESLRVSVLRLKKLMRERRGRAREGERHRR